MKLILSIPGRRAEGELWELEFADYSSLGTQITIRNPRLVVVAEGHITQAQADSIKLLVHGEI